MRRIAIVTGIVAGTLIPSLVATVWLFGCCVLPFHRVMHRLVPLCRIATSQADHGDRSDQQPSTTPQAKQRPVSMVTTEPTSYFAVPFAPHASPVITASPAAYRSFITLGAVRCDRDIGLHTLIAIFLI